MVNGWTCTCRPDRTGKMCEIPNYGACASNPCVRERSEKCEEIGRVSYFCTCKDGFVGTKCQSDDNECLGGDPCLNGAQCINNAGSYSCQCLNGFSGRNCEINIPDCISTPCSEGSTCVELITGGFKCQCDAQHTGERCEYILDAELSEGLQIALGIILATIMVIASVMTGAILSRRQKAAAAQKMQKKRDLKNRVKMKGY